MASEKEIIHLSVRSLVEQCLRSGDLVIDFWETTHPLAAIRAHQQIQKGRPPEYRSEVPISAQMERDEAIIRINGRMDGLFEFADCSIVDEIKTTRRSLEQLRGRGTDLHWGQVKVYSHLYWMESGAEVVKTQLTYCNMDTREILELEQSFGREELRLFFESLLDCFLSRHRKVRQWRASRDQSLADAGFPFDQYRKGQREMAVAIYRKIRDGEQLLVQAPTGIGKTMAALFPAVRAIGEGHIERAFFLTARNTGKLAAEKALRRMRERGLLVKSLTLTAKETICFNPESACNGEECPFASGYYDRVGPAIDELFELQDIGRETVEQVARKRQVCPFELSLDMTLLVDCLICDYNYAFDPGAYLRRLLAEDVGRQAFLVDEAHNLVDRAREMFSAQLSRAELLGLRKQLGKALPAVTRELNRVTAWMHGESKAMQESARKNSEPPESLTPLLRKFVRAAEPWASLNNRGLIASRELLRDVLFEINRFLRVADCYDDSYCTVCERRGREFLIRLYCIDPSKQLRQSLRKGFSAVFFSATMSPTDYYLELIGAEKSTAALVLPTPFPRSHFCPIVADFLGATYKERSGSIATLIEGLTTFLRAKPGNYLVFFPSFEYLEVARDLLESNLKNFRLLAQSPEMGEQARLKFLGHFESGDGVPVAGLAVMGGIFGEAIDLVGEKLSGAAVVTVGLPGICLEREAIREYFEVRNGKGFEFAYAYPGMNRVLQAAGRVIRSETDRGVVLLFDRRFSREPYRRLIPAEWEVRRAFDLSGIQAIVGSFWQEAAERDGSS